MGSSCSTSPNNRKSFGSGRTKADHIISRGKRAFSMTSSSGVNVDMDEPVDLRVKPTKTPEPEVVEQKLESVKLPETVLQTPSTSSTITTAHIRPLRTSQVSMDTRITMDDYPEHVQKLLLGNVSEFKDKRPRQINLYIAACESDSRLERAAILQNLLQPLSDTCCKRGFSLNVIDPNWLEADQSSFVEHFLANRETKYIPTIMLILLNEKLGSSLPSSLPGNLYTFLANSSLEDAEKHLLMTSYRLDGATQPSGYRLIQMDCCKRPSGETTLSLCPDCMKRHASLVQVFKRYLTENQRNEYLKSGFEKAISVGLEGNIVSPENILVMRRTFTDASDVTDDFVDMTEGGVDQQSLVTLTRLKDALVNNVPTSNMFTSDVRWENGLDPSNVRAHSEYIERFCDTLKQEVIQKLTNIMDNYQTTSILQDIPDNLYQELATHLTLCQKLKDIYPSTSIPNPVSEYLHNSEQHPLFLVAPEGTSTHALLARLGILTFKSTGVKVIRFFGLSPESQSMMGMFCSIMKQLGHVFTKTVTTFNKDRFQDLLHHASSQRPLLLVLGEVTESLDSWLPAELPPHVKVIVATSNTSVIDQLREQFSNKCFFEHHSDSDRGVTDSRLNKSDNEALVDVKWYDEVLFTSLAKRLQQDVPNVEKRESSFRTVCETLELQFSHVLVSKMFCFLLVTKSGLSLGHAAALLLQDDDVVKTLTESKTFLTLYFVILRIVTAVEPVLHSHVYRGVRMHIIYENSFRHFLRCRYLSHGDERSLHQKLCEFCENLKADSWKLQNVIPLYSFNLFLYLNFPYHYSVCHKDGFLKRFVFNREWVKHKISATGTVSVLDDLTLYDSAETEIFYQMLSLSLEALDISSSQFESQILGRKESNTSEYLNLGKLMDECMLKKHLISKPSCLRSGEMTVTGSRGDDVFCGLFPVPEYPNLVISLSHINGEITLWDTKDQKPVRQLNDINHPLDLKMVDSQRAVVLCNRELKIYNLNDCTLETSLRGVLNLKTPMFGVQNTNNVITISRNRMYINVLDIASGDTMATFKAGEDRFLNSLTISKNGRILVCGDETQKPSPLLVWELEQSRLVHDLRMAGYEFITTIMDITDDGNYVVCACKEVETNSLNFLVAYDLVSGQVFKIWKWTCSVTCLAVVTSSRCVVSGLETGDLLVWDLVSGTVRFQITGVGSVFNRIVLASDGKCCVTWFKGDSILPHARTVSLWDLENGLMKTCLTLDSLPSCCELAQGNHTVVLGLPGRDVIVTLTSLPKDADQSDDADVKIYGADRVTT